MVDENNFVSILKSNVVLLPEDVKNKNFKQIKKKVGVQNVAMYYQVANCFNLKNICKPIFRFIERWFTTVSESKNFLELDFFLFAKIISSSELHIDSELEVIKSIDSWISYDIEKRSKFASFLISKIRLNLLSDNTINYILNKSLSFSKINGIASIFKHCLKKENNFHQSSYLGRHCSQNNFNIIVAGGFSCKQVKVVSDIQQIDGRNLNSIKEISSMKYNRQHHRSVYCRGAIYVFGGFDENKKFVKSIDKYSLVTNKWENVSEMLDYRIFFCVSRFIDQVFIIGGRDDNWRPFNSTLKYDTKVNKWSEVTRMNKARVACSCAIYEGRVVVSGGWNKQNNGLKTVEAYDYVRDKWSSMPNMIEGRYLHSIVAMKNKLFVLGGCRGRADKVTSCEIFDSESKKFFLKQI